MNQGFNMQEQAHTEIKTVNPKPRLITPAYFGPRILVVAPHPDDEIIGCGGAIKACALVGAEVKCAYLTSGEATVAGNGLAREEKARIREKEAAAAGAIIGLSSQIMVRLPDGGLQATDVAGAVGNIVHEFQPSSIFLPAFGDDHPDHRAAFAGIAALAGKYQAMCYGYEVWSAISEPEIYLDISKTYANKHKALKRFRFAGKAQNYVRWAAGLNTFRSNLIGGRGFVEVFSERPLDKLKEAVVSYD